jgi:hypothetical protein
VRATLAGAPDVAPDADLARAAVLLDVFLDAVTDAVVRRRPAWLASRALRDEIAALFARPLAREPVVIRERRPSR